MTTRDPFDDLKDALSFEPSTDFRARVRRTVAAQPARSRSPFFFRLLPAAAVALVVVALGGVLKFGRTTTELPASLPVAATPIPSPAMEVEPAVASPLAPVVATVAAPRAVTPAAGLVEASAFETMVPDDQRRALEHLLSTMQRRRVVAPAVLGEDGVELNEYGQPVLRALVIEPMKIEPLAGAPGNANQGPGRDPK